MRIIIVLLSLFTFCAAAQNEPLEARNVEKNPTQTQKVAGDVAGTYLKSCNSPRAAIETLLHKRGHKAVRCFDQTHYSNRTLLKVAQRLKFVLESRGVVLDTDKIPNDKYYKDSSGESRYIISPLLPDIYLTTQEDIGWHFPRSAIIEINEIYKATKKIDLGPIYQLAPIWASEEILGIEKLTIANMALLLVILIIGLLARFLVTFLVVRQVQHIFKKLSLHHFEDILKKASLPIGNLVMAGILAMFIPSLELNVNITRYLLIAVRIGAALSGVMLAYRSVDVLTHFIWQRGSFAETGLNEQLLPLFRRGLKITVSIVGGIFILQNLNVDVTSLLAGVTIGGLAFSFAAKDTVANLFGSVTIFADKPFAVGDWVKTANVEGTVESVGFRSTRIRTFYNSLVSVPNSKFTDSMVDNLGLREYRRTVCDLQIQYSTTPLQIEAFCNGIRGIIKAHPKTRKDFYEVNFSGYGDFSLIINVYYFVKVVSWSEELRTRHELYLDILRLAHKLKVNFAFPTRTLHVETLAKSEEVKKEQILDPEELKRSTAQFGPNGAGIVRPGPRLGEAYFASK